MSSFKLEKFGGMLPAWDDHLLPAGQAASCQNAYLFSGALTGWREPKLLRNLLNGAAKSVYRVPTTTQSSANATLVFLANVNSGDTVQIGDEVYRFINPVAAAYDVLLGGTSATSAANLFAAIMGTGTPGTQFGLGTVANPEISTSNSKQDQYDFGSGPVPYIYVEAPTFGAAYNTTAVSENTNDTRLDWIDSVVTNNPTTTFQGGTNQSFDSSITGNATWLEFNDQYTDVMKSPVVDDQFNRYYFCSPSEKPQYNTYARIVAGQPAFELGIPAPGCEPGVNVTGGGDIAQLGNIVTNTTDTAAVMANSIILMPITPLGAMQLSDVTITPGEDNVNASFYSVLYSDNGGAPSELLNQGQVVTSAATGATISSIFTNPTGLLANVTYWIGMAFDTTIQLALKDDTHPVSSVSVVNTFVNGGPLFINSPATGQPNYQLYADLVTSSVLEARGYVYTWVSAYGEEGPPSPPTLVNGWSNGTWTLDFFTPAPDQMGVVRNITKTRIYRTVTSISGTATFYYVTELDVGTTSYVDISDDSVVALNAIIASALWYPPPENLEGIKSMPNGMAVGFKGNELWFCEPYRPHAWPPSYTLTTEFPIIGIGISGNSVVACTSATPYIATGVNPASMSMVKAINAEPCLSRGSVLATDQGVFYASPNGLIVMVPGTTQATNVTEQWITREKWRALTPPRSITAIYLASTYFAFGTFDGLSPDVSLQGFTVELANDTTSFTIWGQPGGHRLGFGSMSAPNNASVDNLLVDPWTGIGLVVQAGGVYYYDFSDSAPTIQPYTWRSKVYQQQTKKNFEAMKFYFTVPPGTPQQNATRNEAPTNDPSWNTLQTGQYGIVRVYADGVLVTTREICASGELLRILSGFKAEEWQWEITGRVLISNMQAATSAKELASV
jgi:hypothetical protein